VDYNSAKDYVESIISDLRDRSGIGDEYDCIDEEIQEEIRERWIKILMEG